MNKKLQKLKTIQIQNHETNCIKNFKKIKNNLNASIHKQFKQKITKQNEEKTTKKNQNNSAHRFTNNLNTDHEKKLQKFKAILTTETDLLFGCFSLYCFRKSSL
ncbi:hypothetical protein Hanom_Chr17g01578561 [Helianthus anomalus]